MFCFRCGELLQSEHLFCQKCGTKKRPADFEELTSEKEIITEYFNRGFEYRSILLFLQRFHGFTMSVSTLKRRLRRYGLKKRGVTFSEHQIAQMRQIIQNEIRDSPSSLLGYRGMWSKLKTTYKIVVPRDIVMNMLREVDPEGTQERKSRRLKRRTYLSAGPNDTWHIDGYDKLKPYGLPIHGCVDGFSRKILWLRVCKTNNNPVVTACHFLRLVKENYVCPKLVRTDCGTENGIIAAMQCTLTNNENGHRYGTSVANQRIENWWSHKRRAFSNWVMDYFKALVDEGKLLLGNYFHMECIRYVFSDLLQANLDCVKNEWNNHFIRRSNNCMVWGIPDELYYFPENWDYNECGIEVDENELSILENETNVFQDELEIETGDKELFIFFSYIIEQYQFEYPPRDWTNARIMFETIVNHYN